MRCKLPPAGMKCVASRFGSEGMNQEPAGLRLPRDNQLRGALKILAGLFFRPIGETRRERRQMKHPVGSCVAAVAACVSGPLFEKDGLDSGFEKLKIKLTFDPGVRTACCHRWRYGCVANPRCEHLPFRIALRLPEFAAGVHGIASGFGRKRMKKKAALQRFSGSGQLQYNFKILARLLLGP